MKIYELGTGYTPIPARVAAATESVVEELTKAFLGLGQSVEIVDISAARRAENALPIREAWVPKVFTREDVRLGLVHKLKRVVYSVSLAATLKKILRKTEEPVILHFHNQYNLFFFLKLTPKKLRARAKIVYTNHNGLWSLPWEQVEERLKARYFQEIEAMKHADLIFALNEGTVHNVVTHLGVAPEKVRQLRNGVNTAVYAPLPQEKIAALKERYGLGEKRVLLQVGSVYENKGQVRALRMLAPLLKEHPQWCYAYAGGIVSEDYREQLLQTVEELELTEQVCALGAVSPGAQMNELYNLADLTVFVSDYEGFPLVCIESIAAGVPVVLGSAVQPQLGEGGLCCPPEKMAETIAALSAEEMAARRSAARRIAEEQYSWERIAEEHLEAFRSIV